MRAAQLLCLPSLTFYEVIRRRAKLSNASLHCSTGAYLKMVKVLDPPLLLLLLSLSLFLSASSRVWKRHTNRASLIIAFRCPQIQNLQRSFSLRLARSLGPTTRGFCTGKEDKIVASVLFERLPVVLPKIDPVVYAFQEFSWASLLFFILFLLLFGFSENLRNGFQLREILHD